VESAVTYDKRDGIALVTLNRPERRNALSAEMRAGLWTAFREFRDDETVVLVLTGAGSVFCAGGDLGEMAERSLANPGPNYLPQPGRNIDIDKPIIAAVNGPALGGGFLLTQSCDLCVAADTATFGISEVRVGRGAPWAVPLTDLIGPRLAMEMLLTATPIDARRAQIAGLVNDVVAPDAVRESALALAQRIIVNAPLSVRAAKRTVSLLHQRAMAEAYVTAETLWDPVYRSADAQEGPAAFRDKRAPQWVGA
jgi:enoyl-CoA hydratase/carnithine racemase